VRRCFAAILVILVAAGCAAPARGEASARPRVIVQGLANPFEIQPGQKAWMLRNSEAA